MGIALKNTTPECGALERVYDHWHYMESLFIAWDTCQLSMKASCSVIKVSEEGKVGDNIFI